MRRRVRRWERRSRQPGRRTLCSHSPTPLFFPHPPLVARASQGLEPDLDLKRICKAMKRVFNCNGSIEEDKEMGEIIQLQGDQRDNVREWLLAQEVVTKQEQDRIVIHGF